MSLNQLETQFSQLDSKNKQYENNLNNILEQTLKFEHNDDLFRLQENIINKLAEHYVKKSNPTQIQQIVKQYNNVLGDMPKAKSAKIVKNLIDYAAQCPNSLDIQGQMCQDLIDWCIATSRIYLLHRIQLKLINVYINLNPPKLMAAQKLIENILQETRKSEDKHLLVECYLLDSQVQWRLENNAKSKASLTACRSNANNIYCKPQLQADIELMSGILMCEDKDYKTAYSYFYEALENYNSVEHSYSLKALKYMIITKVMINENNEAFQLINGKFGLKYAGPDIEAMRKIVQSNQDKSLDQFEKALNEESQYISSDAIIKAQLEQLYNNLLEQNLFKLIEPYNNVQISHISNKLKLSKDIIQRKLSELILDKKIFGTLDQGNGSLIIFDEQRQENIYPNAIELLNKMDDVIEQVFLKSKQVKS